MLQISENPGSITSYINDPDIGNMLLHVSRIYHAERDNMNTPNHQDRNASRQAGIVSGDLDHE
jgi:hypothetical protein